MNKSGCIKSKKVKNYKTFLKKSTNTCARSGRCFNNFVEKMGVYVINCSMHKDRLKKFNKYAKKADVKACRVPCVKGKKFTDEFLCDMVSKKVLKKSADMNPIEISINMSHYNCWKRIANSCLNYGLILEDDVELHKDFVDNINKILEELEDNDIEFSILHLWNGNWNKTLSKQKRILKISEKIQIYKETVNYNAGAVAYIISKKYAEYLLDKFFPIKDPNDILMGSYPKKGNHLTLKMKFSKKEDCYKSPILDNPCGGEGGTGTSTQSYEAPTMEEKSCKKC